ncbi:abortive infection family protein [Bradyrhizobium sp. BRP23]|uniref:abortive infection family protein n=1 Tax=Bradyrhizobium sp. BRP23 TaxID=2793820 RepID=UPI001CD53D40|nr:abortive infection family protein [Bradyrhizobium sp. BRP23]MCA1381462.1 abortive infection family protein [Bradyrhizobium sp. BRP05]MCA1422282.1 abortive infection family protein [Bradyrhizobium sp. BRP23]
MLQHTFKSLEREFSENSDGCIDAAKAIVECACRVIVDNLDNPTSPVKPAEENPAFGAWVSAAVRVLELSEVRDEAFKKLISQHHKLTTTLGDLRNKAGTMSHGKDGFIAKLSTHHRRAALLAADAIVTFLHEAYLERELDAVSSKEPYERFKTTNEIIDSLAGLRGEMDEDGVPHLYIVLPGPHPREEIELAAPVSQLLFELDREAYKLVLNACQEAKAAAPQDAEVENGLSF